MGKTITEKIFDAHLRDSPFVDNVVLDLDVVMCHEITTPIAITDLEARGMDRVFDPEKIKVVIDHVTPSKDSKSATQAKILRDWARRHDLPYFYDVGQNGVCHALFPEKGFIRPGYTVIMGDSHTCTHGAFGAFAAGVGTTDLEVGILKGVCSFRRPQTMQVVIEGQLQDGVYAKDVILNIIKTLTVNGATDKVMEFVGPVVDAMSMESRMTLCNMAVEAGATCGVCLPDRVTAEYLWPFIKEQYASIDAAVGRFPKMAFRSGCRVCRYRPLRCQRPCAPDNLRFQAGRGEGRDRDGRDAGGPGLHGLMHQRPHRGSAGGGQDPAGQNHCRQCPRHSGAGNAQSLQRRHGGRDFKDLSATPVFASPIRPAAPAWA